MIRDEWMLAFAGLLSVAFGVIVWLRPGIAAPGAGLVDRRLRDRVRRACSSRSGSACTARAGSPPAPDGSAPDQQSAAAPDLAALSKTGTRSC